MTDKVIQNVDSLLDSAANGVKVSEGDLISALRELRRITAGPMRLADDLNEGDNLEIINGVLAVRGVHPPEYPAGPEYGMMPYSDAEEVIYLRDIPGWPKEMDDDRFTHVVSEHFPAPNLVTREIVCDAEECGFRAPLSDDIKKEFARHQLSILKEAD